jgi:hypothetical protein
MLKTKIFPRADRKMSLQALDADILQAVTLIRWIEKNPLPLEPAS